MDSAIIILVLTAAVILWIITNLMFSLYHLYMKRKIEYQTRLLNILFSHLAIISQTGSLVSILFIFTSLGEQIYIAILEKFSSTM